jgi:hypothetical protein
VVRKNSEPPTIFKNLFGRLGHSQRSGTASHMQMHAINPSLSLSAPTNDPLQEQMREDYAAQLQGAERELLQQNPSGLGRQEQAIGRELNGYTPR